MRKEDAPIKLCIVGAGAITEKLYLPVLAKMPDCKVSNLIDLDLTRAGSLAGLYAIPHFSQTMDDVGATAEAAVVALPHHLHRAVSCELMKKGLHVLCEKPMATTKADAEEMVRCAAENNVQLGIGNVRRFYWVNQRIKELISSKTLGNLVSFHIQEGFAHYWPTTTGFYFDKKRSGGGVLMDIGAHVLDLLMWWLEDYPNFVDYQDDNCGGVEAECFLRLRFGTSTFGTVRLSRLVELRAEYNLTFELGTVTFRPYDPSGICNVITLNRGDTKELLKAKKFLQAPQYFELQVKSFLDSVRHNTASPIAAASIVPSIQLIEECYQSASRLQSPLLCSQASNGLTNALNRSAVKDLKVLVTGATGFIGGRVAERLYLDYENIPRCLVQNYSKLARLARFPTEITVGNLLDPRSVRDAVAGCDVVVHCAYGNTEDEKLNDEINVAGTKNLILASLEHRVKKFIYLSSVEVYGEDQPASVDELTAPGHTTNRYSITKLESEKMCLQYFKDASLPVVVLRLAVVYGPFSPIWTNDVVRRLLNRGFCISPYFNGTCNPVYIDDCVNAIFLSIGTAGAVGETFIISGGETLTWNDYFAKYNEILGMPKLRTAGTLELRLYGLLRKLFDVGFSSVRKEYGHDMSYTYNWFRERGQIPNVKALLQWGGLLQSQYASILGRRTYYSIAKAKRTLGFEPAFSFDAGMMLVKQHVLPSSSE